MEVRGTHGYTTQLHVTPGSIRLIRLSRTHGEPLWLGELPNEGWWICKI